VHLEVTDRFAGCTLALWLAVLTAVGTALLVRAWGRPRQCWYHCGSPLWLDLIECRH
jgi:hypothetical protein